MAATFASPVLASPVLAGPSAPARPSAPVRFYEPRPSASTPAAPAGLFGLRGLRLTRRGRVVVVALALLLSMPVVGLGGRAVASNPGEPIEVTVHTVQPGDTLWGFARQIAEPGTDLRAVVTQLRVLNELPTAALQVGQTILLPKA